MNKQDLIDEVAQIVETKSQATAVVNGIIDTIINALKRDDAVTVAGFGTFKVGRRKARKGINPRTGQEIQIKAKNVVKFNAGKALKDSIDTD